jgi:hypothetical protein
MQHSHQRPSILGSPRSADPGESSFSGPQIEQHSYRRLFCSDQRGGTVPLRRGARAPVCSSVSCNQGTAGVRPASERRTRGGEQHRAKETYLSLNASTLFETDLRLWSRWSNLRRLGVSLTHGCGSNEKDMRPKIDTGVRRFSSGRRYGQGVKSG